MTQPRVDFEALVDAVEDAVLVFAPAPEPARVKILHINAAYAALLGQPAAQLVGTTLEPLMGAVSPADRQVLQDAVARGTATEVGLEHHTADGEVHPLRLRLRPLGNGLLAGILKDLKPLRDLLNDGLTGLLTRRAWTERAEALFARSQRYGWPLSLAILDLDHFKEINDQYGHATGDAVLRDVCAVLRGGMRRVDLLGRIGGEELGWIGPDTTLGAAQAFADRVRCVIRQVEVAGPRGLVRVTTSIGIAERTADDPDLAALMDRADRALYRAKHAGRDQVIAA